MEMEGYIWEVGRYFDEQKGKMVHMALGGLEGYASGYRTENFKQAVILKIIYRCSRMNVL